MVVIVPAKMFAAVMVVLAMLSPVIVPVPISVVVIVPGKMLSAVIVWLAMWPLAPPVTAPVLILSVVTAPSAKLAASTAPVSMFAAVMVALAMLSPVIAVASHVPVVTVPSVVMLVWPT